MPYTYALLGPDDRTAIVDHLLGLDRDDRVLRFSIPASDDKIREYCDHWKFGRDVVMGAWDGPRLMGLIHLPVYAERDAEVGEIGVSVGTAYRSQGIATQIAARVLVRARRLGLARVYIHYLTRNRPMGLLARAFTSDIVTDDDESHATIHLPGDAVRKAVARLRLDVARPGSRPAIIPLSAQRTPAQPLAQMGKLRRRLHAPPDHPEREAPVLAGADD
jgi:GNAT superfamily N-acetyltransferase